MTGGQGWSLVAGVQNWRPAIPGKLEANTQPQVTATAQQVQEKATAWLKTAAA